MRERKKEFPRSGYPLYFLGGKNSQKIVLEKKSRRNRFGGFDAQFLQFGEKISEKKSFSKLCRFTKYKIKADRLQLVLPVFDQSPR